MKIYTRTGDSGDTGLFGGPRVRKHSPRIEAYGTIDELNSVLGLARAAGFSPDTDLLVASIQHQLFDLGAELASPKPVDERSREQVSIETEALEREIDRREEQLTPLKQFILPGGTAAAAWLHLARTVCRRAERKLVFLADQPGEIVSSEAVVYLNRLSDLLFVLARFENANAGVRDIPWVPRPE